MSNNQKFKEHQLYDIWQKQNFNNSLQTLSGLDVTVLDVGELDFDTAGPDFKHARIRIGNLTYVGDIEIDTDYNDWKSHGHNIDKKYDKLILHVSLFNKNKQQYVYTKDGRKVPTLSLMDHIDRDIINKFNGNGNKEKSEHKLSNQLKCCSEIEHIEEELKRKYISQLGIERFDKKCKRIFSRLKEIVFINEKQIKEPVIGYDLTDSFNERKFIHDDFKDKKVWEQVLYEIVFEALGYSKNKTIMMSLAQAANLKFMEKLGNDNLKIESALFNIAGIIPKSDKLPDEETSEYTKDLNLKWEDIKTIYDGQTFCETQWHFFKLRPQNFPTIRIAGGAILINAILYDGLVQKLIKKVKEIRKLSVLVNSLRSLFVIKSRGFWQKHYVFDQPSQGEIKYFIGASRADEIVINVILPFLSVYFDIFGMEEYSKKVLKLYSIYEQRVDNKIVKEVAESLNMTDYLKKTVYTQGMIELFRSNCSKNKCLECEIGKIIFN